MVSSADMQHDTDHPYPILILTVFTAVLHLDTDFN